MATNKGNGDGTEGYCRFMTAGALIIICCAYLIFAFICTTPVEEGSARTTLGAIGVGLLVLLAVSMSVHGLYVWNSYLIKHPRRDDE